MRIWLLVPTMTASIIVGTTVFSLSPIYYFVGIEILSILWPLLRISNVYYRPSWLGFIAKYIIAFLFGMNIFI